jgi:hypothetical protein
MSCDQVHAGPTGAAFSLALIRPYPVHLTGASNSGLDRAGMVACWSLVQTVSIFLSQRTDEEARLAPLVLDVFVDDAFASFSATQAQLESEEDEIRESELRE